MVLLPLLQTLAKHRGRGCKRMNETIASTVVMKRRPLRMKIIDRMLSTDERVELWCGAQYYFSSIWIATNACKTRERKNGSILEVGDLRDITSSWHIIIIYHSSHIMLQCLAYPISNHQNTSNRDHIRCKEMSVVNHDGYPPSLSFISIIITEVKGSTRAFYF